MITKLIDLIIHKNARRLDGYKTIIGAMGMILTGIIGLAGHYWPATSLPAMELDAALTTITGGFAVLGIGGKLEKNTLAQKDLANKLGSNPAGSDQKNLSTEA